MDPQPAEVLQRVVNLLDSLRIPYAVGGSYASSIYGVARFTRDVDLVVDLAPEEVETLAAGLSPEFYVDQEAMRQAVRACDTFNAIQPEIGFKVDFFILGRSAFDRQSFGRRRAAALEESGASIFFYAPEDMVLRKLEWYRKGGEVSEQQWRDVIGILLVQRDRLDTAYLKTWAAPLGVSDLLERVTSEAAAG